MIPRAEKTEMFNEIFDDVRELLDSNYNLLYSGAGQNDDELDKCIEAFTRNHDEIDWIKHGVSKIVISFSNIKDFVIKIPFMGYMYKDYGEAEYHDFENADVCCNFTNINHWDYCETEMNIYQRAVDNYSDVEKFFAATFILGDIGDVPIYASERVDGEINSDCFVCDKKIYKEIANITKNYSVSDLFQDMGLPLFLSRYGQKKVEMLVDFIDYESIEDIHDSNIGIDSKGNYRIIDYSSWND